MFRSSLRLAITAIAIAFTIPSHAAAPARTTIFTGEASKGVLAQCSRPVPKTGSGWFRPSKAQVASLDRAVAARLSGSVRPHLPRISSSAQFARDYAVEVIGIERDGRRYVYGNYYPLIMQDGVKHASPDPIVICDGGPRIFGAEIDVSTGAITHFAANGAR